MMLLFVGIVHIHKVEWSFFDMAFEHEEEDLMFYPLFYW